MTKSGIFKFLKDNYHSYLEIAKTDRSDVILSVAIPWFYFFYRQALVLFNPDFHFNIPGLNQIEAVDADRRHLLELEVNLTALEIIRAGILMKEDWMRFILRFCTGIAMNIVQYSPVEMLYLTEEPEQIVLGSVFDELDYGLHQKFISRLEAPKEMENLIEKLVEIRTELYEVLKIPFVQDSENAGLKLDLEARSNIIYASILILSLFYLKGKAIDEKYNPNSSPNRDFAKYDLSLEFKSHNL